MSKFWEILDYRRRMGLCEYCGNRMAVAGFPGCAECDPPHMRKPRKWSPSLCHRCHGPRDRADRKHCARCLADVRQRMARWRGKG